MRQFSIGLLLIFSALVPSFSQERSYPVDSVLLTLNDEEKLKFYRAWKISKYTEIAAERITYAREYLALAEKLQRKEDIGNARFLVINAEDGGTLISANEAISRFLNLLRYLRSENISSVQPTVLCFLTMTALDGTRDIAFALEYGLQAVESAREQRDTARLGLALNLVADAYLRSGKPQRALPYCKESLLVRESIPQENVFREEGIVWTLHNIGLIYEALGKRDSLWMYYHRAEAMIQNSRRVEHLVACALFRHCARICVSEGKREEAKGYVQRALAESKVLDYNLGYQQFLLSNIAAVMRSLGMHREALQEAEHALNVAERSKSLYNRSLALRECALAHAALGNPAKAFALQEESRWLADSLALQNTNRTIQETETRITTARANETLLIENVRKEQQRTTTIAFSIAAVLLVSGLGGTLYFRTRATSARRLLEESEKAQRAVVQATFNGVEQERKRVQRELHDGVQSKLVAAQMAFSTAERVLSEQAPQTATGFMRSLNDFGTTISEISAIAQNLIPANLEAAGLAVAVEDFISAMRPAMPRTEILLNVEGIRPRRFAPDRELSVYRLVQEIVNNCRKHAEAESLVLDFVLEQRVNTEHGGKEEEWLVITGEDEGRGFAPEMLASSKRGLGLSTMQSRVHALSGTITIDSAPERGTRIIAAIPLEI